MAFQDGMYLAPSHTIGGYPIYQGADAWKLVHLETTGTQTQGDAVAIQLGVAVFLDTVSTNPRALMTVLSNLSYSGPNQYWAGEPCKGTHLFSINKGAGYSDNCLTINVRPPQDPFRSAVIEVIVTQSESGGRTLRQRILLDPSEFGLAPSKEGDWTTDSIAASPSRATFMLRLRTWAEALQNASRKAIAFNKPQDAFANVPNMLWLAPPAIPAAVVQ